MHDSPPFSTDVESEWSYSCTPNLCRHGRYTRRPYLYFRNTRPLCEALVHKYTLL